MMTDLAQMLSELDERRKQKEIERKRLTRQLFECRAELDRHKRAEREIKAKLWALETDLEMLNR